MGDPEQFGLFYERTETAMLAFFRARTGDSELAIDLTAETFAQALKSRRRYDPARGPARGWLFGIAGHVLARSMRNGQAERRMRRRLHMEPLLVDDYALERVEELADVDAVAAALEGLPADQREAVRARVLAEEPYVEIAARLRCSEAVVRKRVSRGVLALRAELIEPEEND